MSLRAFLDEYFQVQATKDEDGFYHYLLTESADGVYVSAKNIEQWEDEDIADALIIDCNDDNVVGFSRFVGGRAIADFHNIKAERFEVTVDDDPEVEEEYEAICFYSSELKDRYIRVETAPEIHIALAIDWEAIPSDEEGAPVHPYL